jgi:predicted nucleic acid-binding protein
VIIISDTNILSSLAAGDSLPSLLKLFAKAKIAIPFSVKDEIQVGFNKGQIYLETVLQAIETNNIEVLELSAEEELLIFNYPNSLNEGERDAIALAQTRKATLLCNDKRAIQYCKQRGISVINLVTIFRLLWTRKIITQDETRSLIARIEQTENLQLTHAQYSEIFAPY